MTNRTINWFFGILFLCLLMNSAHAAEPTAANPQAEPVAENPQPAPAAADPQPDPTQAAAPKEIPSIQIPETTFDFGEVMEGNEIIHEFTVKNAGKGSLQIDKVQPG